MLEFDKSQYSTNIKSLEDFITGVFVIICEVYAKVTPTSIKRRKNIDKLKMSDGEIITIAIVCELVGNNFETVCIIFASETSGTYFLAFATGPRFNRIRRNSQAVINPIRKETNCFIQPSKTQIVDSLPLQICKFGWAAFHKDISLLWSV